MTLKQKTEQLKRRVQRLPQLTLGSTSPFPVWLTEVSPGYNWDWPHIRYIIPYLDLMTAGEITRLMVFLPPRHGKSSLITERFAAHWLISDPTSRIIIASYGQELAEGFSRKIRRIVSEQITISPERFAVGDWETAAGGGVFAAGIGTGVTGKGANLLIIDDPVKGRDAVSRISNRDRIHDWYTNVLLTRLEPGASVIFIMTRWHQDDLAGRILSSEDPNSWTVIRLPAEAEDNDPLGRKPGEALCPDRYDLDKLADLRCKLGLDYHALYQQMPMPRDGALFKRQWFPIVESGPDRADRVRFWDKAGTVGGGAYTCGLLMARTPEGEFIVEDVIRVQWSPGQREKKIKQTAERDKRQYGRVSIVIEQEPGSAGKESFEASKRNLAEFVVKADRVTGSKEIRAEQFAAQCEAGNVKLVRGPWNDDYLDELTTFPFGTYNDQVDASSGAFNAKASNFIELMKQRFEKTPESDQKSIPRRIDEATYRDLIEWSDE